VVRATPPSLALCNRNNIKKKQNIRRISKDETHQNKATNRKPNIASLEEKE
jgi:hypothetical protein